MDIRAKVEARKAELLRTLQRENSAEQQESEGERSSGLDQKAEPSNTPNPEPIRDAQVRGLMQAELEAYIKSNFSKHYTEKETIIGVGIMIAFVVSIFVFWPLAVVLFFAMAIYAAIINSAAKARLRNALARGHVTI